MTSRATWRAVALIGAALFVPASCTYDFDFAGLLEGGRDSGTGTPPDAAGAPGTLGAARFLVSGRDVRFWYDDWVPLSGPVMRSATGHFRAVILDADGPAPASAHLQTTTPSVVALDSTNIDEPLESWFAAKQAGEVQLRVMASDGSVVDWIPVEVAALAELELSRVSDGGAAAFTAATPFELSVGEVARIDTRALDAQGRQLIVSNSIDWTLSGTSSCALRWIWSDDRFGAVEGAEIVDIEAIAPGAAVLSISADGLVIELMIEVSAASQ